MAKLNDNEYFGLQEISNSDVKMINSSWKCYLRKSEKEVTPAMKFGTGFHSFLLENDTFYDKYGIINSTDAKNSKEYKQAKLNAEFLNPGKTLIPGIDFETYNEQKISIWSHPKSNILHGETLIEEVLFWDFNGVKMRGKLDIINLSKKLVIDLKTCADIGKVDWDMRKMYDSQAFLYKLGAELNYGGIFDVVFIFVEKKAPFDCKFIRASNPLLKNGENQVLKALATRQKYIDNPDLYAGAYPEIELV